MLCSGPIQDFCHQGSKSRPRAPAAYQCSESSVIPRSYQGAPKDSYVKEAHTNKQGIFYGRHTIDRMAR